MSWPIGPWCDRSGTDLITTKSRPGHRPGNGFCVPVQADFTFCPDQFASVRVKNQESHRLAQVPPTLLNLQQTCSKKNHTDTRIQMITSTNKHKGTPNHLAQSSTPR